MKMQRGDREGEEYICTRNGAGIKILCLFSISVAAKVAEIFKTLNLFLSFFLMSYLNNYSSNQC